ncbi:MAG: hypothetical protein KDD83_14940 [Caldilineaceae bacterium]|nr:hypothetical protein [Caldilineaceae bacterium]
MSAPTLCQATTKAGTPCQNHPVAGSPYCYVHRNFAPATAAPTTPDAPAAAASTAKRTGVRVRKSDFDMLVQELNSLAAELQRSQPSIKVPEFSAGGLVELIKRNLDRFTPDVQMEIIRELKGNLEGTSPKDLIDPETWKGLWYILNYSAQAQSKAALAALSQRLSTLPGMALAGDLKGNLEGTSPKDLVDPDTWKGMFLIMNYSARATATDLKRKLLGDEDEDGEE